MMNVKLTASFMASPLLFTMVEIKNPTLIPHNPEKKIVQLID